MKLLQRPSLAELIAAVRACIPTPDLSAEGPSVTRIFRPPLVCKRKLNGVRLAPYFIPPRTLSVVDLRLAFEDYAVTQDYDRLTSLYDERVTEWLFPPGLPYQHHLATLLWAISRMAQLQLKFAPNSVWVESDTFFVGVVNGALVLRFTQGLTLPEFDYKGSIARHVGERPTVVCRDKAITRFWIDLAYCPDKVVARQALSLLYHTVKDKRLLVQAIYEGGSLR